MRFTLTDDEIDYGDGIVSEGTVTGGSVVVGGIVVVVVVVVVVESTTLLPKSRASFTMKSARIR